MVIMKNICASHTPTAQSVGLEESSRTVSFLEFLKVVAMLYASSVSSSQRLTPTYDPVSRETSKFGSKT